MPSLARFLRVRAVPGCTGGTMPGKVRAGPGEGRGPGRVVPAVTAPVPLFQGKAAAKGSAEPGAATGPVVAAGGGSVRVAVRAKPGRKILQLFFTDVTAEAVGVAIAAPPSEGEANAELCRYLSKVLQVKKSDVTLEKGGKSRDKVVKILVSATPDEILEKLKKEASS
uniref:CO040 protein n=1 Tax=Catharus ustulatus TaxID=91951 RepID=A0A8C3VNY6_CATUS